ncbi:FAD dependent oxidoreductase [Purpureocillium lavendulum]|uniref:FAD dependent oxidoreductase n=1 Tax=Purpureocillium lavendulum TaxID=1247861 RepID=A0AB34FE43_9HYPO|nr:FAD dependent oxidoreductase [Purpureocillium lavendulum]
MLTALAVAALVCGGYATEQVIFKDVAIIGGGASGSYAAVRIREDFGKSVALIEKKDRLVRTPSHCSVIARLAASSLVGLTCIFAQGGHVDSFVDPETNTPLDFGVKSFIDEGNATGFFDRLGIKRKHGANIRLNTTYVDFSTGKVLGFTPPPMAAQMDALKKYLEIVEPWEHLIQPGYFDFPDRDAIPHDFLIPFGEFVTAHGLEEAVPFIYQVTGLGLGNITNELTLFVLQTFTVAMTRSVLGLQDAFIPESGRNQDVYDAVAGLLGSDVFYSSTVFDALRTRHGVKLAIKNTDSGHVTVIKAKRLLIAIEPTAENTGPFHLDAEERETFSKFRYTRRYAGIIKSDMLAVNASYFNLPPNAAPKNYLSYPEVPYDARIDYMGTGKYFRVNVIGDKDLEPDSAKELVRRDIQTLMDAGVVRAGEGAEAEVDWADFSDHGPMYAHVSGQEVEAGFIQNLYGLQGRLSTWWTGAAWSVHYQTALWKFDDILIPKLLSGL